jgi:hypothetical protein
MHPLNSILRKFITDFDLTGGLKLSKIKNHWKNIVGHTIASHTCPYILRNGILTLTVDTPQWMHHLGFFKEEIKEKLKEYNVHEVRFSLGKLSEAPVNETKNCTIEISDSDKRYINNTLKVIKDKELKDRLRVLLLHAVTKGKQEE